LIMSNNNEREAFEAVFPVPDGVYWEAWSESDGQYEAVSQEHEASADIQHARLQGWQAARAQSGQGAEPIGYTTKRHVEQLRSGRESCQGVFLKQDDYHTEPLYTQPQQSNQEDVIALLTNALANIRDTDASAKTLQSMAALALRGAKEICDE
jgi:hypothetical protein